MRGRQQFGGLVQASTMVAALAISAALPTMTTAASPVSGDGYVRQTVKLDPLGAARTLVLRGVRIQGGACHYDYPEAKLPGGVSVWEVRDVAIDAVHCRKIVEEGVPLRSDLTLAAGDRRIDLDVTGAPVAATGAAALTSTASGYNWTWWEDVVGIKVNQDRTNISWAYTGSCASSGSTSGQWSWAYGTGWAIVSYGGSDYQGGCAYYRGTTYSTYQNSSFCWPLPTVYTYYSYVRAFGYADGSIGGTRSTDSVDECAPLFMHYQVRKVT